MSTRRLRQIKVCAVCAQRFRPCHQKQLCCSRTCGAIRRVKLYPYQYQMQAANAANRARIEAELAQRLEPLTKVQAYRKGRATGYQSGYQKALRELRRSA